MGKLARHRLRDTIRFLTEHGRASFGDFVKVDAAKKSSLARIKGEDGQNVTLNQLDLLATALGVEPWQLLHPDGEAATLSDAALKIARKMDDLPPELRERAYALFVQAVDFANPSPPDPPHNGGAGAASAHDSVTPKRLRRVHR